MLVRPLPKKFLIHKIIYRPFIQDSRSGGKWGGDTAIDNVCVDYQRVYSASKNNQSVAYRAIVYYDCFYSRPKNIEFSERDILVHDGIELVIVNIAKPNWNRKEPHHIELRCV